ncbi:MAG: winged helix-turn-helix transcriptional regulator [Proteobacteria bacterium]|nr:winged helix-turn-helix transcriptional regulator [Pseudomonadota bacterium]
MRALEELFGNKSAERVLLFMQNYGEGYGREIAKTFGIPQPMVRNQLLKLENAGWLVSRPIGRTRLYSWNPGNPLVKPLRNFLDKSLEAIPEDQTVTFFRQRRRPRKAGKPIWNR